jgi:SAM-dependent methyltransferase
VKAAFTRLIQLGAKFVGVNGVGQTDVGGAVDEGEGGAGLAEVFPDELQHEEFVEVGVEEGAGDGVEIPVMIVRAAGQVDDHDGNRVPQFGRRPGWTLLRRQKRGFGELAENQNWKIENREQGSAMEEREREKLLREEFNRWAEAGRGDGMERDHLPITLPVLERMRIAATDNVLDVGCGSGWLARRLAKLAPEGRVVGMDVSDEMIRAARRTSLEQDNILYVQGEAGEIPWEANFFQHAVSVESAYYWPEPRAGMREIFRVLRPGGAAWILINYYRDNPHCHQWGPLLAVETRLLLAEEWMELFREAGFGEVAQERVVDGSPTPESYMGRWFRDAEQLRAFKAEGALLVRGVKR